MIWAALTPQEKQALTRQAVQIDGLTYGQAAARLGTSRLSIAGVVERTKTSFNPILSTSGKKNQKDKPKKKKPHAGFHKFVALPVLPEPEQAYTPARSDVWEALPGSSPVPIADHREGCRFPIGEDRPYFYCNDAVKPGSPYCASHSAVAFRDPVAIKKRKEPAE